MFLLTSDKNLFFTFIVRVVRDKVLIGFEQLDVQLLLLVIQILRVAGVLSLILHVFNLMAQSLNLSV
jgi:hypothetical protein